MLVCKSWFLRVLVLVFLASSNIYVSKTLFICCAFSPVPLFFTTEGKQGVKDVEMKVGRPASPAEIAYWEKVTFYIEGYL